MQSLVRSCNIEQKLCRVFRKLKTNQDNLEERLVGGRIMIIGNAGGGKSILAKKLSQAKNIPQSINSRTNQQNNTSIYSQHHEKSDNQEKSEFSYK